MGNYRFCPKCGVAPDNPHGCRMVSCVGCQYSWEVDTGKEVDVAAWIKAMQSKFVCPGLTDEHYDDDPRVDKAMRALDTLSDFVIETACAPVEVDRLRAEKAELEKRYNDLYDKFCEARDEIERLKSRIAALAETNLETLRRENETDHKLLIRVRDLWRHWRHPHDGGEQGQLYVEILERLKK